MSKLGSQSEKQQVSGRRFIDRLPTTITKPVRVLAWLVFITQVLIVGTGGAVRLTGSGLGCNTWPKCTDDSFVTTPEMGIHGAIEFGNRTLFFLLEIIAILAFIYVWRLRKERKDLFWLTLIPSFSVFFQAILGGITVLTHLNPYVVGLHYFVSVVLVVLAALLVYRVYETPGPRKLRVGTPLLQTGWIMMVLGTITIALGIITTGAGPHAGDGGAARNGLEPEILQHFHAWPAYTLFAFTLLAIFLAHRARVLAVRNFAVGTLLVMLLQIIVGVAQARNALPPVLVGIHMVLATVLAAGLVMTVVSMYGRTATTKPLDAATT